MNARWTITALGVTLFLGCGTEDDQSSSSPSATTNAASTSSDQSSATTQEAEPGEAESTSVTTTGNGQLTLENCVESFADGVATFYSTYFACVAATSDGAGTTLSTDGLPPHPSAYYAEDDPNYVPFDDRGGTHRRNPNNIGALDYSMTVPENPVAKGIEINASLVDNTMNTSEHEYSGGPVGIALNGVTIFAAMAAAGDDLAEEQYTFDLYEGHPAGTTYHYHFETKGPLEVLEHRGISDDATPGEGNIELYGVMCDGALVLGCTELDGSAPQDSGFDSQNGHVHDLSDGTTTHFSGRYHTHVCPSRWPDYPFFPEIAYYETTNCGGAGQATGPGRANRP